MDKQLIAAYNKTRDTTDTSVLCHAPFTSINFEQNGNATACCYNRTHILGTYPKHSLKDMWFGPKAQELRKFIKNNDLGGGCEICRKQLLSKNYYGVSARNFDQTAEYDKPALGKLSNLIKHGQNIHMPVSMEFELSNTCNLECTMCSGYYSSSIRKNREHLPPMPQVYDEGFVDQLRPFIPYLKDAKFLGGEPFLVEIYYQIWEAIAELNPGMNVHITTNATIWNKRVNDLLQRMHTHIVLSIDSLVQDTYEQIRINAKFDRVRAHVDHFIEYTRKQGTDLTLTVCPMPVNYKELPQLVQYCHNEDLFIHFNTVLQPQEHSFRYLSEPDLLEVIEYLKANRPNVAGGKSELNLKKYDAVISQCEHWLEIVREENNEANNALFEEVLRTTESEMLKLLATTMGNRDGKKQAEERLNEIAQTQGKEQFVNEYFLALDAFHEKRGNNDLGDFKEKSKRIAQQINQHHNVDMIVLELIRVGPGFMLSLLEERKEEEVSTLIESRFL